MNIKNYGDWGVKAGALALAFFLWFHAVTEHFYEKEIQVRLQVEDPPPVDSPAQQLIVANALPAHVRVLVSGRGKDLLQVDGDFFVVRIRPEGNPGTSRYRITSDYVENRASELEVQIEEILEPKELEVVLERRMEREVPVRLRVAVQVAEAYIQVGATKVVPAKTRISGPRSLVSQVQYIDTDTLVLSSVREDVDREVALLRPREQRFDLSPAQVRVQADIQILVEDDVEGVPVRIVNERGALLATNPSRVGVRVRGGVDVIANLDALRDLDVYVDYSEYGGGEVPVHALPGGHFEVVEIAPPRVGIVEK